MGEAKRRRLLGIPPRGEEFEEGVSHILDGQAPLQCGDCHQEVVPEAMLFVGRCRCGKSVGSCHMTQTTVDDRAFCGGFLTFLLAIVKRFLGPEGDYEN